MIITRSPLRISLGGGGTDLPSYYQKHTGFLLAAAIDKYVCITLHHTFVPELIIKYSKLERVVDLDEVQHPIIREALKLTGVDWSGLEITSMADIPAGTGLGSSGSFTTALLKALHTYRKNLVHPRELAEQACHIELERLKEPIGKQDQYIAAYGGLTCFQFLPNGQVEAWPLRLSSETLYNLEDNLLLFFTGYSRSASSILKEQDDKSRQRDQSMVDNLHFVKELGYQSKEAMEAGERGSRNAALTGLRRYCLSSLTSRPLIVRKSQRIRMPRSDAEQCRAIEATSPGPSPTARKTSKSIAALSAAVC